MPAYGLLATFRMRIRLSSRLIFAVTSVGVALSGCTAQDISRAASDEVEDAALSTNRKTLSKMPFSLLVSVNDELGNAVNGASVQALVMEKGKEDMGGMTFVVQDGVDREFASDMDHEVNGQVLFAGKRWELAGKPGSPVRLTVEGEGLVTRVKTVPLDRGRKEIVTRLVYPLKVNADSKALQGLKLSIGEVIVKDGGPEDADGLENGQIYAKLSATILREDVINAAVYFPGAAKPETLHLPASPYGWRIIEKNGKLTFETQKKNED